MELKNSKTEANLMAAFAGESQARNKYTYYAGVAREGYEQIAAIFEETAGNEKRTRRNMVQAAGRDRRYQKANLLAGAEGEDYEWTVMYDEFAKEAEKKDLLR